MNTIDKLSKYFNELESDKVCIAFSGGVDSSLVLKMAILSKKQVMAVMFNTKLHPCREEQEAREIALDMGLEIKVINIDEFSNPDILKNPIDRCYICKKLLFSTLIELAQNNNCNVVLDGTNYDDYSQYRPGIKALKELGVKSPLAELKITKNEVRETAKIIGLKVHNKPSAPCMATRFPYNTEITFDDLSKVESAEEVIKDLGIAQCRVRVHNDIARVEIPEEEFERFILNRKTIIEKLKSIGYSYITLDIEGFRSGSMDINIDKNSVLS